MARYNPCETVLGVDNVGSLGLKWSYSFGGGPSSPAVVNGVVYIGALDNNVYALNARNGAKLWSYTTGNFVGPSPAVVNGVVYVGSEDGKLYALNANTGSPLWTCASSGGWMYGPPWRMRWCMSVQTTTTFTR